MNKQVTRDFIRVIDNSIPHALCDQIVDIFNTSPNLQQGKTGGGIDLTKKNSMDVSIQRHPEFEPIFKAVNDITAKHLIAYFADFFFALIGPIALTMKHPKTGQAESLTIENFDTLGLPKIPQLVSHLFRIGEINAQKYQVGKGGYPYWHSEIYPQQASVEALHRNLLFMYYLNDVDEGGETEFYYQQQKIKPVKGRMVIAPAGFTHTHRGNQPISNDKFILTSWVLFNPAEHIFGATK